MLDDAQVAVVGEGAKRFPVAATINGYTWRTSYDIGPSARVAVETDLPSGRILLEQLKATIEPDESVR